MGGNGDAASHSRKSLVRTLRDRLLVPYVKRSSVGRLAFRVAGTAAWNSLQDNVMSARSPSTFRQRLKTFLSSASFPAIIVDNHYHIPQSSLVDPKVIFVHGSLPQVNVAYAVKVKGYG